MNRRHFIRSTSGLALASGAGLLLPNSAHSAGASRVAFYRHSGLPHQDEPTRAESIRRMVDLAVQAVADKRTPEEAWKALFAPSDVVAVKVNCMAGLLSPSLHVMAAIVEGLKTAGVDPDRITIFDKEDRDLIGAGYTLNPEPPGPLCLGTVGGPKGLGYNERFTTRGSATFRLSNIVEERTTAIVNVPVVKDHVFAGITGALKNHFGTIHNPEDFHYLNNCSPAVAEVNLAPSLKGKQRLIVGDALHVQYEGGPSYEANHVYDYWAVFAGTDPVAVDSQLLLLIDTLRQQNGLPTIAETDRPCRYLEAAAERELGTLSPDATELIYADLAEEGGR
ncbi:MAG: DUF362 domain-containing protein [Armatimonadetes bacterium]|nr:DUF362 domain-containing protein [Armatimonadota bacterium]